MTASEDMESWFTPVVQKILAMIGDQMRQAQTQSGRRINVGVASRHIWRGLNCLQKILLVGGFGDSQYLLQSVRQWSQGHGVRVICPSDP